MSIEKLIESGVNVNVTLTPTELVEVIDYVVKKVKMEMEEEIRSKQTETYMTTKEVCDFLSISEVTIYRWEKRGYLTPLYIGGKKRYPRTEIEKRFTSMNN